MEILSSSFDANRMWRRRRYQITDGSQRKNMRTVRFGESNARVWRIKAVPRLRLKMVSPLKLWTKFKNAYMNKTQNLFGSESAFGGKRVPKARQASMGYSNEEFQSRLIFEIYKNMMPSHELATI